MADKPSKGTSRLQGTSLQVKLSSTNPNPCNHSNQIQDCQDTHVSVSWACLKDHLPLGDIASNSTLYHPTALLPTGAAFPILVVLNKKPQGEI
jgi:hypothetical protein